MFLTSKLHIDQREAEVNMIKFVVDKHFMSIETKVYNFFII